MNATISNRVVGACVGLLAGVAALALAGCNPVNPPIPPRNDPNLPRQINLTEDTLRNHTAFMPLQFIRDPAGILFVTAPLRNTTNHEFTIDWRVTFFDRNGQSLFSTSWTAMTLAPNVEQYIQCNSTTREATDVQLDVRIDPASEE